MIYFWGFMGLKMLSKPAHVPTFGPVGKTQITETSGRLLLASHGARWTCKQPGRNRWRPERISDECWSYGPQ